MKDTRTELQKSTNPEDHLGLVYTEANRMMAKWGWPERYREELVSELTLIMVTCCTRFEVDKGHCASTYIMGAMRRMRPATYYHVLKGCTTRGCMYGSRHTTKRSLDAALTGEGDGALRLHHILSSEDGDGLDRERWQQVGEAMDRLHRDDPNGAAALCMRARQIDYETIGLRLYPGITADGARNRARNDAITAFQTLHDYLGLEIPTSLTKLDKSMRTLKNRQLRAV